MELGEFKEYMKIEPGKMVASFIRSGYDINYYGVAIIRPIKKVTVTKEVYAWKSDIISDIFNYAMPGVTHGMLITERSIERALENKQNIIKWLIG